MVRDGLQPLESGGLKQKGETPEPNPLREIFGIPQKSFGVVWTNR